MFFWTESWCSLRKVIFPSVAMACQARVVCTQALPLKKFRSMLFIYIRHRCYLELPSPCICSSIWIWADHKRVGHNLSGAPLDWPLSHHSPYPLPNRHKRFAPHHTAKVACSGGPGTSFCNCQTQIVARPIVARPRHHLGRANHKATLKGRHPP